MKLTTSELFTSPQGEAAPQSGKLSSVVWVRFARCPFTCAAFNNPLGLDPGTNEGLGFDPTKLESLSEMPEIKIGCDSRYSISDKRFEHLWTTWTPEELADAMVERVPVGGDNWQHPVTHQRYGVTFTGGEPTLQMKGIIELLAQPQLRNLKTITFETNCAVPLMEKHMLALREWCEQAPDRMIYWSNSPKLSVSGEPWDKAVVPKNALMQRVVGSDNIYQYFKFVVDATDEAFDEVARAMDEYHHGGIPTDVEVYVMPMGGVLEQQQLIDKAVSAMAIQRGYHLAWRSHIYSFGALPGV